MKTIIAESGQTIADIAIQEMGDVAGSFDILDLNPYLRLDMAIPAGTPVFVPDTVINAQVVDYYTRNGIKPASGLGEEIELNLEDMTYVTQKLNYNLAGGDHEFDGIRLWNLKDKLTVQVNYTGVTSNKVSVALSQSLDGLTYDPVPGGQYTLDQTKESHTFNVIALQTNYVRAEVILLESSAGTIDSIVFKV